MLKSSAGVVGGRVKRHRQLMVAVLGSLFLLALFGVSKLLFAPEEGDARVGQLEARGFRVIVEDVETGARLLGAAVELAGQRQEVSGGVADVMLPADERGESVALSVRLEGYVEIDRDLTARELREGEVRVRMFQWGMLSGVVVDSGVPVVGVSVEVVYEDSGGRVVAEADARGEFVVRLRPGLVRVSASGLGGGSSVDLRVTGGQEARVTLDVTPTGDLKVEVSDENGVAIKGALVSLTGASAKITGIEGGVSWQGLRGGRRELRVAAGGFSLLKRGVAVSVSERVEVSLSLKPLEAVRGEVMGPGGKPVAGASVSARPLERPRSADWVKSVRGGGFVFAGVDEGEYMLQANHPRYGPSAEVEVSAGESVTLTLTRGGAVEGRVWDEEGAPAAEYTVVVEKVRLPDGGEGSGRKYGRHRGGGEEGEFVIERLEAGQYDLYVDAGPLGYGEVKGVEVESGEETSGVEIRLVSGVDVWVKVTDAESGEAISGATVMVMDGHRRSRFLGRREVKSDKSGEAVMMGLAPGRRSVDVVKQGYHAVIRAGLEVKAGEVLEVPVALRVVASGEGRKVEFHGIGAVLGKLPGGGVEIKETVDGGPALSAGLRSGDELVSVDERSVSAMSLREVVEKIRGEEGSSLRVTVKRSGELMEVELARGRVVYKTERGEVR